MGDHRCIRTVSSHKNVHMCTHGLTHHIEGNNDTKIAINIIYGAEAAYTIKAKTIYMVKNKSI